VFQRSFISTLWVLGLKGFGLCLSYVLLIVIAQYYGPEGSGLYNLTTNAVNLAALTALMGVEGWMLKSGKPFVSDLAFWKYILQSLRVPAFIMMALMFLFASTRSGVVKHTLYIGSVFVPVVMAHTLAVEGLASAKKRISSELMRSIWRPLLILMAIVLLPLSSQTTPLLWAGVWTMALTCIILWQFGQTPTKNGKKDFRKLDLKDESRGFWWIALGGFTLANICGFYVEAYADVAKAGVVTVLIRVAQLSTLSLLAVQVVWAPEISQAKSATAHAIRLRAVYMGVFLALLSGCFLWVFRTWIFSFFGTAWQGIDTLYAPILMGQVLYSASAGWMVWSTMRGASRSIGFGFLLAAGLQCLAWTWSGSLEYIGWIHGVSFALLAIWNVQIGQRCTFEK